MQFESEKDTEYAIKFTEHSIKGKKVGVLPYQQQRDQKGNKKGEPTESKPQNEDNLLILQDMLMQYSAMGLSAGQIPNPSLWNLSPQFGLMPEYPDRSAVPLQYT